MSTLMRMDPLVVDLPPPHYRLPGRVWSFITVHLYEQPLGFIIILTWRQALHWEAEPEARVRHEMGTGVARHQTSSGGKLACFTTGDTQPPFWRLRSSGICRRQVGVEGCSASSAPLLPGHHQPGLNQQFHTCRALWDLSRRINNLNSGPSLSHITAAAARAVTSRLCPFAFQVQFIPRGWRRGALG